MAANDTVEIRFTASTDEVTDGVTEVRDVLADLGGSLGRLGSAFAGALPTDQINQCVKDLASVGAAAQSAAGGVQGLGAQIAIMKLGLSEQRVLLDADVRQFKITQDQKFALLKEETAREYAAELELLNKKLLLGNLTSEQQEAVHDKMVVLEQKSNLDILRINEQSIAAQQALWTGYLSTLTGAFNSQLRGLLEGTTSWHTATIKMFEDLTIKFIEMAEQMVVKWLAAEVAQTTATTTGAAARAAAEQSGASTGILANSASAVKAIMADAGQAFAGVFAFLAPTMGPAAAGPAAAAQASVSAAAIYEAGTDYVVRGGLALIRPGETIIPAARGSGPYTGAAMRPQVHAPVSINVSALDSQSVARFFNDNSSHMMRAINAAVKRGAHLGLRAVNP